MAPTLKVKVTVTSNYMIRPSSPTPDHLKTLHFSLQDQFAPHIHMPLLFFYPSPLHDVEERSILLKRSLSETLVRFYPLAGRLQGNESIDCNDEGVEYCEAHVSAKLSEVIEIASHEELLCLLPFPPVTGRNVVTGIQVNQFLCGGMAISVCISHKIPDAATIVAFLNAWALRARDIASNHNHVVDCPEQYNFASLFPPGDLKAFHNPEGFISKEKIVTKRFIFNKKTIDMLKEQATGGSQSVQNPTRVEVVSALIWKRFIEAAKAKSGPPAEFSARQAVNLRSRLASPISDDSCFGNVIWFTTTAPTSFDRGNLRLPVLVSKFQEAKKQIKSFVQKLQNGECLAELKAASESSTQPPPDTCMLIRTL